jgi:CheY-like chemotaxis protein
MCRQLALLGGGHWRGLSQTGPIGEFVQQLAAKHVKYLGDAHHGLKTAGNFVAKRGMKTKSDSAWISMNSDPAGFSVKTQSESAPAGALPAQGPRIHRHSRGQNKKQQPKRILLVDDNKIILKTTGAKLKEAGYEVLAAEDGGSAIRQARQLKPHLILLDLNFPPDVGHGGGIPWDGLLILSWLRRNDGMEKIPVIVVTGGDLEKYKDRWVEAGIRDIFLKPVDHDGLIATIKWTLDEFGEPDPPPATNQPAAQPAAEAPAQPAPVPEAEVRRKILFVDDTSDWRYLGVSYLGQRGYEVATAEDAISAMLQASQFKPNLVVLDLNLAGQSAAPLVKALSGLNPDVRILIHTGMDLSDVEVSGLLQQGAWNCLRKGSLEELASAIEETFSGKKGSLPWSASEASLQEAFKAAQVGARNVQSAAPVPAKPDLDSADALQSLGDLRAVSTEELVNAVQTAKDAPPAPVQAPPGPVVISEETIKAAAQSVLIVEDEAASLDRLRSTLESHSFRVSAATTGAEALSLITVADIDLIFFDLTMPDFPVRKFYDAVRAVKPHLCRRIVYMKSDGSQPSDDDFVRRLHEVSIWKPFQVEWVLEAVQTIRRAPKNRLMAK